MLHNQGLGGPFGFAQGRPNRRYSGEGNSSANSGRGDFDLDLLSAEGGGGDGAVADVIGWVRSGSGGGAEEVAGGTILVTAITALILLVARDFFSAIIDIATNTKDTTDTLEKIRHAEPPT